MRCLTPALCTALLLAATPTWAQTITSIQPRTCQPGATTKLTLLGADLDDSLRMVASSKAIAVRVEKIEPTQAIVELSLAEDAPLGPFGLWIAGASGPLKQLVLVADDLAAVADNGNNHASDAAQSIAVATTVEGTCDGASSDFYKFSVTQGQRVAFEIQTQQLNSSMDPVLRLLDAAGETVHFIDDSPVGPDSRFAHSFATAGEYYIEVHDSRHAAAGAPYQLRLGDFPIVSTALPLAVQAGQTSPLSFAGVDAAEVAGREFTMPADAQNFEYVAARLRDGQSSTWVPVAVSPHPQLLESTATEPLALPVGFSGRLAEPREVDAYQLIGTPNQTVRVSSRTRSLGAPTLLQMQLLNAEGAKVAESTVSAADEWSFDFTFPDAGIYRLEVSDLLKRGGEAFSYWVEIAPNGTFQVALKAEAAVREEFILEQGQGACPVDLTVTRFGYDGEIEISFAEPIEGLRILNPRIAAGAAESRIYLIADAEWTAGRIAPLRMMATAVSDPGNRNAVSSRALHRVKTPFVLAPAAWSDGRLLLAGAPPSTSPFALEPASPLEFARPLTTHAASLTLKRLDEAFKGEVTVLGSALPGGWSVTAAAENETYKATFTGVHADVAEHPTLPLQVFGEHNGRGRLETYHLPVRWIDPVQLSLEFPEPLVAGGSATVRAVIQRQGGDPQPLTLALAEPPPGVVGPESIAVAADQSHVDFILGLASDVPLDATLTLTAACKTNGQDFTITSAAKPLPILQSPAQLTVYPEEIALGDHRSRQQLVVTGVDADQAPRDWTRYAKLTVANSEVAEIRGSALVPKADGETELTVSVGGLTHSLPVRVSGTSAERPVAFESETLVALSKQGCNSGACHGSPSGKGGFRLSLRAFDMQLDELTLIREEFGRRVNTLDAEKSLLLQKPMMKVPHGGGKQLHRSDAAYEILREWIAGGALPDPAGTPRVERLEVYPSQKQVLSVADGGRQLAVTAHFADGSRRDVTELVAYETSDTSVATVDVHGFVTPHGRGEIAILVRFLEHIESVPLMFVEQIEGFQWRAPTPNNYIDELVNAKLRQLQYLPSETCSDAEFLRRSSLDVTGLLPTVAETEAFLADPEPDKRARWVDALLERDEYAKFWALKWGDLLRMTSKLLGDEGVYKYHRWLEESLRENMPYDEFARQLLTGAGSTLANPPANFYRTATDMNECVETISQVFLGARLQCAKCHNHPFERWTQDNYYGLGAFFNRVERRTTERPGEMFVYTSFSGDVTQPRTGAVMAPWLPRVGSIEAVNDQDRRIAFADWLVEPSNPYFARIEANRIWSQLFSRGIVDPIDDFRDSNPPSNAPLLDALAEDFVASGFNRKHLLRRILASRTYQASYQTNAWNQDDVTYGSHQEPRLLSAEQLLDAINQALDLKQTFGPLPAGTKATQLPAPDLVKVDFLKTFGQPERSTVCACERADDSNLGMAIELFNGPMIHEKLRDENNRFRKTLAAGKSTSEAIEELYLAAVCRPPSEIELQAALDHCAQVEDSAAALEDVCWALFNTDEFLFQH